MAFNNTSIKAAPEEFRNLVNTIQHKVRTYCHNCGKEEHLNEVNVLGIKFALCDDCFREFQEKQNCCPVFCNGKHPWYK